MVTRRRSCGAYYGAHQTGTGGISSTTACLPTRGLRPRRPDRRPPRRARCRGPRRRRRVNIRSLEFDYVNGTTALLTIGDGGTSAASPLWASLTTQFNTIFHDQGLPDLGYYNDLIYIAAAIAPGSFNDIQLGNNITSFYARGHTDFFDPLLNLDVVPTGHGYSARRATT